MKSDSVYHVISWNWHKARRRVKSIGAAETLAAGDAVDIGKILEKAYATILQGQVDLVIVVDTKDIYTTLSTQRELLDKSIRRDVGVIRFEIETKTVAEFVWILRKLIFVDNDTKFDCSLIWAT